MNKLKEKLNELRVEPEVMLNIFIFGVLTGVSIAFIYYAFVK